LDEKVKRYLKWGGAAVIGVIAGIFMVPLIITALANIVLAAAYAAGLFAMWVLAPTFVEGMLTLGWRAKQMVWKSDPIAKLWRDLHEFGEEIESLNTNIEQVATEEMQFETEIKNNRDILGPEKVLDWNERLSEIRDSKFYLIEQREELRILYKESERDVRVNEVEWKLGNAYNKAANAVNKASGIAGGTQGGKIAMATIQQNLSQGRARLQTLRTMKSSAEIREIMKQRANPNVVDTTAKEVKPTPALQNNPSPVLQPRVSLTEIQGRNPRQSGKRQVDWQFSPRQDLSQKATYEQEGHHHHRYRLGRRCHRPGRPQRRLGRWLQLA
jgi:regulator of replication initiation timing